MNFSVCGFNFVQLHATMTASRILLFIAVGAMCANAAPIFFHKHHEEVDHHHYHHDEHKHKHEHEHKPQEEHDHHHHYHHHEHKHDEHQKHHKHGEHKHHDHKHHDHHKHHEHKHHTHHEPKHHEHHEHKNQDHEHHHHEHHHHHHEHKVPPHYEFKYGVRDPHTGDIKNQWEVRTGDDVLGEYSLVEADGTIRRVQYTAGKHTGFNAVVKKEGKAKHPVIPVTEPKREGLFQYRPHIPKAANLHSYETKGRVPAELSRPLYFELPANHKPVFVSDDLQKHRPDHTVYGIGDYLSKRSSDMGRITEVLNRNIRKSRSFGDPIRAVRGRFVMGK